MSDFLSSLSNLFTLTFVVSSMFSLGLQLTVRQIIEPLRNARLVLSTLLANFVVVPAAALLLSSIFNLNQDLRIGMLLFSFAAGAAFATKLAQVAKSSVRLATSLIVLLIIATVVIIPLALPLLLQGVQVDAVSLARPLILQLLLPLALGILMDSIFPEAAESILPALGQIANISLALMLALLLGLNLGNVIGLLGTGAVISILLLLIVALTAGYFLGGPSQPAKEVLSLATGQRNIAAAFVIATGNFPDRPNILIMLAAAGLISMVLMMPVAAQMGKRRKNAPEDAPEPAAMNRWDGESSPIPVTGETSSANLDDDHPIG